MMPKSWKSIFNDSCHFWLFGAMLGVNTLFSGSASAEGRTSVHPDLRGVWARGGCSGNDAEFLVMRGTVVLVLEEGAATSQPLITEKTSDAGGWLESRFEDDEQPLFLRRVAGNPDVLEFAGQSNRSDGNRISARLGPAPDPLLWDIWQLDGCAALPPGPQALYGEVLAVLEGIDDAETACALGAGECALALFAIADVHPDNVLTVAEISRMLRVLVQLGAIEQGNGEVETQVGTLAASIPLAPILAKALVSSFDYGGDNALSLDEILRDRVVLHSSDMSDFLAGAEARVSEMMGALETRATDLSRLLMLLR